MKVCKACDDAFLDQASLDVHECFPLGDYPSTVSLAEQANAVPDPKSNVGIKHDQDKPRTDLLDYTLIEGISKVLGFGAKKYDAHNWRKGISTSRLLGACLRHVFAFMGGQDNDPESGESHLYHAGCCLMFAAWMVKNRPDLDDRWKSE